MQAVEGLFDQSLLYFSLSLSLLRKLLLDALEDAGHEDVALHDTDPSHRHNQRGPARSRKFSSFQTLISNSSGRPHWNQCFHRHSHAGNFQALRVPACPSAVISSSGYWRFFFLWQFGPLKETTKDHQGILHALGPVYSLRQVMPLVRQAQDGLDEGLQKHCAVILEAPHQGNSSCLANQGIAGRDMCFQREFTELGLILRHRKSRMKLDETQAKGKESAVPSWLRKLKIFAFSVCHLGVNIGFVAIRRTAAAIDFWWRKRVCCSYVKDVCC